MKRIETEKIYHVPGMQNFCHRKRNCIFFGHESTKHILAKCIGAMQLNKYSDVKFTLEMMELLNKLSESIDEATKDFVKNPADYLCEVVPNSEPNRRVDLLCLDTGQRYAFETKNSEV